jgi:mono/diheme cytochrome c family protein
MLPRVVFLCASLITFWGLSFAQEPKVVNIPVRHTSANSGKEMFAVYCAACHRKDGKGDGPVWSCLRPVQQTLPSCAAEQGEVSLDTGC